MRCAVTTLRDDATTRSKKGVVSRFAAVSGRIRVYGAPEAFVSVAVAVTGNEPVCVGIPASCLGYVDDFGQPIECATDRRTWRRIPRRKEISAHVPRQTRRSHSGGHRFDPVQLHQVRTSPGSSPAARCRGGRRPITSRTLREHFLIRLPRKECAPFRQRQVPQAASAAMRRRSCTPAGWRLTESPALTIAQLLSWLNATPRSVGLDIRATTGRSTASCSPEDRPSASAARKRFRRSPIAESIGVVALAPPHP